MRDLVMTLSTASYPTMTSRHCRSSFKGAYKGSYKGSIRGLRVSIVPVWFLVGNGGDHRDTVGIHSPILY